MKKKYFITFTIFALLSLLLIWLLNLNTGISGQVHLSKVKDELVLEAIADARVKIWYADKLIKAVNSNYEGKFNFHVSPGLYELRVDADGFVSTVFGNLQIERFRRKKILIPLQHFVGYGNGTNIAQSVDSTSVIEKAGTNDIWRTWENQLTGTPHRVVGSAVRLPSAPQNEEQAVAAALEFLSQFVRDNENINPALSRIDLSTLKEEPAYSFKNKWFVTFSQSVVNPYSGEDVPVYGSEASVTISGSDIIQFGMDLFPEINVKADKPPLSKTKAVFNLVQQLQAENVDTTNVQTVIFPFPIKTDKIKFEYLLAYQLNIVVRSKDYYQPFNIWSYVIDATSGKILFRQVLGVIDLNGQIKAHIYEKSREESGPELRSLNSGKIGNDNIGYQEILPGGFFRLPSLNSLRETNVLFSDLYFSIHETSISDYFSIAFLGFATSRNLFRKFLSATDVRILAHSDGTSEVQLGIAPQSNTYCHLNEIRLFFVDYGIEQRIHKHLNIYFSQDYDNAFYNPFYEQLILGNKADPLGLRSDVIYHEYTHYVVDKLVTRKNTPGPVALPYQGESGAINEALADYYACSKNEEPEMRAVPEDYPNQEKINRNLKNTLKYDKDFQMGVWDYGYVHDNSRIFSGVLWDLREMLRDKLGKQRGSFYANELILFALQIPPTPLTFKEVSINLLLADDDDNRLGTGTPNFRQIRNAFNNHNITFDAFELNRPTIQFFEINTIPKSKDKSYIEEGRKARVNATIIESESGLDINSICLKVNEVQKDIFNSLTWRQIGKIIQLDYTLDEGRELRTKEFGPELTAVLSASDLTGNQACKEISLPIEDHEKPNIEYSCECEGKYFNISITIFEYGSGIDLDNIAIIVDNKDMLAFSKDEITDQKCSLNFRYPKDNERHSIYVKVIDYAGNEQTKTQEFKCNTNDCCKSQCVFLSLAIVMAIGIMKHKRRNLS